MGNAYRGDDAVGLVVARALRGQLPDEIDVVEREGEPSSLIAAWEGYGTVWLVDAASSGAPAGTVHRIDATAEPLPAAFARTSTHHVGLPEAVELARVLGRLPRRLIVYGVEGLRFDAGETLTAEVEAAAAEVAAVIASEAVAAVGERHRS